MPAPNQNLVIAQVCKFLNANGYLAWRQENNGRIDEGAVVTALTRLLTGLAHVDYKPEKVAILITDILRKSYRAVPCSLKGVSDVIGFHLETGRWISVEVKIGLDKLRPEQEVFRQAVRESGAEWWLCREIESFKAGWYRKHQPEMETV